MLDNFIEIAAPPPRVVLRDVPQTCEWILVCTYHREHESVA